MSSTPCRSLPPATTRNSWLRTRTPLVGPFSTPIAGASTLGIVGKVGKSPKAVRIACCKLWNKSCRHTPAAPVASAAKPFTGTPEVVEAGLASAATQGSAHSDRPPDRGQLASQHDCVWPPLLPQNGILEGAHVAQQLHNRTGFDGLGFCIGVPIHPFRHPELVVCTHPPPLPHGTNRLPA